jgi:hypothetical protein
MLDPSLGRADTWGEMTAPRTCRACGANLKGNVMWCLQCYAPVRQLTPRPPQPPTVHFVQPKEEHPMSRWKAGATTFGPIGRIAITLLVLLFAPWSMNGFALFVLWPPYLVLATLVLRATWKKDHVQTMTVAEMAVAGRPSWAPPDTRMPFPRSTVVVWLLLGTLGLGVAIAWATGGQTVHALIAICASLIALVLALRWLLRA